MPRKKPTQAVNPEVLPYLRAALSGLFAQQRTNGDLYMASNETAQVLLGGLARHGLIIVPNQAVAKGRPSTPEPAGAGQEPRRIYYTQAETNKLVKQALARAWPEVPFFLRSAYGCTSVYYLEVGAAPTRSEVEEITDAFEGAVSNNCDGRDAIERPRLGPDGHPEIVRYGADFIRVYPVTRHGAMSFRQDGRTHIKTITDASLQAALVKGQPAKPARGRRK